MPGGSWTQHCPHTQGAFQEIREAIQSPPSTSHQYLADLLNLPFHNTQETETSNSDNPATPAQHNTTQLCHNRLHLSNEASVCPWTGITPPLITTLVGNSCRLASPPPEASCTPQPLKTTSAVNALQALARPRAGRGQQGGTPWVLPFPTRSSPNTGKVRHATPRSLHVYLHPLQCRS